MKIANNQLTFTDGRFYINDDGQYYPSVTTLLEAYPKPYALLQWMKEVGSQADQVRDAAGERGSTVHNLTELYDKGHEVSLIGDNGKPSYGLQEWAMFERYVEFTHRHQPLHHYIEQSVICPDMGCAGTIDRICEINGRNYILDIKTSNGVYNSYWLQLAAYRRMAKYMGLRGVDGVAILWLNAKTRTYGKSGDMQGPGWQCIIKDDTDADLELFQAVQKLWLAENKDARPKSFTYQLTHKRN
jgi:hypothetical protein